MSFKTKVKCKKHNPFLEVDRRVKEGDIIDCPINCPKRQDLCRKATEYKFKVVYAKEVPSDNSSTSSSNIVRPTTSVGAETVTPRTDFSTSTSRGINSSTPREGSATPLTREETASKYNRRRTSFSDDAVSPIEVPSDTHTVLDTDEVTIDGIRYSDNIQKLIDGCKKPNSAYQDIFYQWNTSAVFTINDTSKLTPKFDWIISKTEINKKRDDIRKILSNDEYNVNQKFYHLFYDVIYKYQADNIGFCWSEVPQIYKNSITPKFISQYDFAKQYCEDVEFRRFYREHKQEIISYLNFNKCATLAENEKKLIENIPLIMFKYEGRIVLINQDFDSTISDLGSIDSFFSKMKQPQRLTLEESNQMIAFLDKFCLTRDSIKARDVHENEFRDFAKEASKNALQEDNAVLVAAGVSNYSEYNNLLTLIHEYINIMNPSEIRVGDLQFSARNYSNELIDIIFNFCRIHFGNSNNVERARGNALLAKSLYERNVIGFTVGNAGYIKMVMKIVSTNNVDLDSYYEAFDNPEFVINGNVYQVRDLIRSIVRSNESSLRYTPSTSDISDLLGSLQDIRITKYLEYKRTLSPKSHADEISSLITKLEKRYNGI